MRVLLLQLDGKIPNLALMRIAAHHAGAGDSVELRRAPSHGAVERRLGDAFDRVYASLIFQKTRPVAERLRKVYPDAILGGTGWDLRVTVEQHGITTERLDYSLYPAFRDSIGFTQRGCRLACSFCVVRPKEGPVRPVATIADIWRGDPWPRHLLLLDNDFFGQPGWARRIDEINAGQFKVSWNQGFNVRLIDDEQAAAIASTRYYDDQFRTRRLYTAWDNRKDEALLFRNLEALARHGVRPDQIMVYILIGYDHAGKSPRPFLTDDDFHRQARLMEFGARPYPMPFIWARELQGFQRWLIGGYAKRVPWPDWVAAKYQPANLGESEEPRPLFD